MSTNQERPAGEAGRIRVFDTTLRDGEQTPGVHITADQKAAVAERLEAFGVTTIEAGFPASSPGEFEAVGRVARVVKQCEVAALARCVREDIDAVVEALRPAARPVVHVVLGTSDVHLKKKLGMTRAGALRRVRDSVSYARTRADEVEFSLEDATRTERLFLRQVVQTAVEAGAARINVPDTVGCALPNEYGPMIADVVRIAGPDVVVSAHCHNDMGLATANTLAAVQHGARQVEVTVNGIGERAGNAAVEEVGIVLAMKGDFRTSLDMTRATDMSRLVSEVTGIPIQPNRPVVGANAFAHSSGIHQDGIIKDPENYQYVPPAAVGAEGHRFVLTARSGRKAVVQRAAAMGYCLAAGQVDAVYRDFLRVADRVPGAVSDAELEAAIRGALSCAGD